MVTATLTVCERGNTVHHGVTHVHSEYRGCSRTSGFKRSDRGTIFFTISKMTMILTLEQPSVMMVRARRVESDRSEWLALTAVMTAISAVHRKAARALFRFRKFIATGQHDLLAIVKMPAAFGPTRPRSRATSRGRPIRTYVGTVLPAWQPQKTNWCHGLTAESDTSRPVGQHHCAAENGRSVSFFPLWPPFYDSDGPGEAWNGSVRPRWASLRPDGARTVPRSAP